MEPAQKRGVPPEEHKIRNQDAAIDWNGVRIFLEVVRNGSFRSAAEKLGQSINLVRRRVDELEYALGFPLLTRHVDGVRLTSEGQKILVAAEDMERATFALRRVRDRADKTISGEVRLAVTEGLGTFWIIPRLVELQRAYPRLLIDMRCAMESADVLRMEADACVQLTRPTASELKVVKLGRLHVMPFAAQSYIDTFGTPRSFEELLQHKIVLQVAEQVSSQTEYDRLFPGVPQPGFVAMRTNVTSAHYWSIAKGAGIGMLPTYAHALGARIVPIEIGLRYPYDIWLTYHPDASRIQRARRLIDWIMENFDARQFPWFRDEFIHPYDLPKVYGGEPLINLFEGFLSASNG